MSRDLDVAEEGEEETGEESDEADAPEDADGSEESLTERVGEHGTVYRTRGRGRGDLNYIEFYSEGRTRIKLRSIP